MVSVKPPQPEFSLSLLHPRYWFTWLWMGLWWLSAQLPYRVQLVLGRRLGAITYVLAKSRREIADRNLQLCLPDMGEKERQLLVRRNFESTGIAVFETGMAWFWPRHKLQKLVTVSGFDTLQEFVERKQGVLLVVLHFTTLEMLGAFTNHLVPTIDMTYRPHNNPVYDFVQGRQRARHNPTSKVLSRDNARAMVRSLKNGRCISYLPDQDYGRKNSVFVPFFGVIAATVTALARLASMSEVPVIPLFCQRREDGRGYDLQALPAFEHYPSNDPIKDAETLNAHVEACIRRCPEQYLWVHRRFKTRPRLGDPSLYPGS